MLRPGEPAMRARAARGRRISRLARDVRGAAAVELALIGGLLIFGLFNTIDLGRYFYMRMEVQNAAQMGAQAVWKACDTTHLPATTNCSGMSNALSAGVQSTSLGSSVSQVSGSPAEGWYCVNNSDSLVLMASASSAKPADCSAASNPTATPGDYLKVQTTYAFSPVFPAFNIAAALPSPITGSSLMRLQ
jgi:Flp pilus assembly protein TadG